MAVAFSSGSPISEDKFDAEDVYSPRRSDEWDDVSRKDVSTGQDWDDDRPMPVMQEEDMRDRRMPVMQEEDSRDHPMPVMQEDRRDRPMAQQQNTRRSRRQSPPQYPPNQRGRGPPPPDFEYDLDIDNQRVKTTIVGKNRDLSPSTTYTMFPAILYSVISTLSLFFLFLSKQNMTVNIITVLLLFGWIVAFCWFIGWLCQHDYMMAAWITAVLAFLVEVAIIVVVCVVPPSSSMSK